MQVRTRSWIGGLGPREAGNISVGRGGVSSSEPSSVGRTVWLQFRSAQGSRSVDRLGGKLGVYGLWQNPTMISPSPTALSQLISTQEPIT